MSTQYSGESLWGENSLTYKCGCVQIAGKTLCPIHQKEIKEQMIYGSDTMVDEINEGEKYHKFNLNEGMY